MAGKNECLFCLTNLEWVIFNKAAFYGYCLDLKERFVLLESQNVIVVLRLMSGVIDKYSIQSTGSFFNDKESGRFCQIYKI